MTGSSNSLSARRCPACQHDHAVGTTCCECERCLGDELSDAEEERFQEPRREVSPLGYIEAEKGLFQHNHNLGLNGACDGTCGMGGCRRPYFDRAGLTRYRDKRERPSDVLDGQG